MTITATKIGNEYLLKHDGYGNCTFIIDGQTVTLPREGGVIDFEPKKCFQQIISKEIDYYVVNGSRMEVREWNQKCNELHDNYDVDNDEWISLEDEYAWRKFEKSTSKTYKDVVTNNEVNLIVFDYNDKYNHPYIKPLRLITGQLGNSAIFQMDANLSEVLRDVAHKWGYAVNFEKRFSTFSNHGVRTCSISGGFTSDLSFLKINDSYVLRSGEGFSGKATGTFDECEAKLNKIKDRLNELFRIADDKISPRKFNDLSVASIYQCAYNSWNELQYVEGRKNTDKDRIKNAKSGIKTVLDTLRPYLDKIEPQINATL